MNNTDWLKLIKGFFLRRWKISIGLGLISIGVTLLFIDWVEIILVILEKNSQYQDTILLVFLRYFLCFSFIASGVIILISTFFDERKLKYFNVNIIPDDSYIYWHGDKNKPYPDFYFEIPMRIENGKIPSRILSIKCMRYVEGLPCSLFKPEFKIYKSSEEKDIDQKIIFDQYKQKLKNQQIEFQQLNEEFNTGKDSYQNFPFLPDYINLSKCPKFNEYESQNFIYKRKGRGPTQYFHCERLEDAEYQLEIEYKYDGENSSKTEIILIERKNGELKQIHKLSSPPKLNNAVLKDGFERGVITKKEFDFLLAETTEQERYFLILEDEKYLRLSHRLSTKHLHICLNVNKKLLDDEYDQYKKDL